MKILMMTNTYAPIVGGIERSIQSFAEEFRREGHQVMIAVPEYEGAPEDEVDVLRLPAVRRVNETDFSVNIPVPGILSKLFRTFQPDIVHAHHPFLMGDMALRMCGQYGIPLVFTHHTLFDQYTHYLPLNNEGIKRFVIEIAVGYSNLSDHVIAPGNSIAKLLRTRGVETPISVIPTGIDTRSFSQGNGSEFRKKFDIPEKSFVIGYSGRLAKEKNLDFLSEVIIDFLKIRKDAHCLMMGDGPSKGIIRNTFEDQGVADRLHLTGFLPSAEVVNGYYAMDVFAFASKSETQGMVIAEALSSGIPVVALNAPGACDVVQDNINGYLLEKENKEDFLAVLKRFACLNEEERIQFSEQARESVQDISLNRCAKRVLDIYGGLDEKQRKNSDLEASDWQNWMNRMKTEWEMLENLGNATKMALSEAVRNRHIKKDERM